MRLNMAAETEGVFLAVIPALRQAQDKLRRESSFLPLLS